MSKFEMMICVAAVVYAIYLYSIYTENGKKALLEKLKEHAVQGIGTIVVLVGSVWLTAKVSNWVGAESVIPKFLIWVGLMIILVIVELMFLLPKKKK